LIYSLVAIVFNGIHAFASLRFLFLFLSRKKERAYSGGSCGKVVRWAFAVRDSCMRQAGFAMLRMTISGVDLHELNNMYNQKN